jgi:hypothetical protein
LDESGAREETVRLTGCARRTLCPLFVRVRVRFGPILHGETRDHQRAQHVPRLRAAGPRACFVGRSAAAVTPFSPFRDGERAVTQRTPPAPALGPAGALTGPGAARCAPRRGTRGLGCWPRRRRAPAGSAPRAPTSAGARGPARASAARRSAGPRGWSGSGAAERRQLLLPVNDNYFCRSRPRPSSRPSAPIFTTAFG